MAATHPQVEQIRWEQDDDDGVVVLTLDRPGKAVNTLNAGFVADLASVLDRLEGARDTISGVVVTSAKKTFFAGADLDELSQAGPEHAAEIAQGANEIKALFRRLETLGKPVVAALNGSALGGGLELALACHHRITVDDDTVRFGFPEVQLGLLPGGGGVVRTVRMLGVVDALTNWLAQGQRRRPPDAQAKGLIDELVATREELLPRARRWISEHPEAVQRWDVGGYKIPGGTPSVPSAAPLLAAIPPNLRKQLKGAPYPAPHHIMCAAVEGTQVDFDTAGLIETRWFTDLAVGQTAKNMTQAFFFDLQAVNSGSARPDGHEPWEARKVAVLGAGMMGAGIAYACATSGIEVVLKDVSREQAEKGRAYAVRVLDKLRDRGKVGAEQAEETLARITPTDDVADLAGCDLVIEAVFESMDLKRQVFGETEPAVGGDALLASNTSTLPISELAGGVERRDDFVGLHFFSPVDKMPLVEIVRGRETSDRTIARAFDVVRQIGKTPIVVNDSRGFFTSRVIGTYISEAVAMLGEGVNPVSIERAGEQAGYPVGPLGLNDEVSLSLTQRIAAEAAAAAAREGRALPRHPAMDVVDRMVDEFGRPGRAGGAGFYDYPADGPKRLWDGLWEHFVDDGVAIPFEDLEERMLFVEAIETVRCVEEGVITSAAEANIGSIMGIGYPPWTGGVLQYVDGYAGGVTGFVARAKELADRYGNRFTVPALLVQQAERGEPLRAAV